MGGQDEQLPTQVLADQLTLSQPKGEDCAPHITTCPPSSRYLLMSLNCPLPYRKSFSVCSLFFYVQKHGGWICT